MASIQHVFKRGSVYWWRRRLPIGTGRCAWVRVELSLQTKELELARSVASEVTLASHRLLPGLIRTMISAEDAKRILIQVATEHSAHLDSMMYLRREEDRDPDAARRMETCVGWALRLYAAQGQRAKVGAIEEREMRAAGLDDEMIECVVQTLGFYQSTGFVRPGKEKLKNILRQNDVRPIDPHLQQAEALYLRGMAAALLNTERRWSGARTDDLALVQSALQNSSLPQMLPDRVQGQNPDETSCSTHGAPPLPARTLSVPEMKDEQVVEGQDGFDLDEEEDEEDEQLGRHPGLKEIVTTIAAEKVATEEWSKKTAHQHKAVAGLFVRFVGHDQPRRMRQANLSEFRSLLFKLPKNHGKSPKDHVLPVNSLVERAETLAPEEVGLSVATINRYMTQLGNIVSICKHAGYPFGSFEGVAGLRTRKKNGSVREERAAFQTAELRTLFDLPVWTGAESFADRLQPGGEVHHDATYWVPLLSMYNAARREENCGLMLSEIEVDSETDLPCFSYTNTVIRKLKNPQSKRRIPVHPELIRLGFLDYVKELRTAGHTLLFPELRAASASTPMGDVFDESWQRMRAAALPDAKEQGKVLHSLRHWCNNEMKQAKISAEIRRDILGHSTGDVNEGRYADAARLLLMNEALSVLPLPTAHLTARPIRLIDQVVGHTARASRKSRKVNA